MTGMSGAGKSSALLELGRLGFTVVDTDAPGWKVWGSTGDDGVAEWIWDEDRMDELLATDARPLYISGCVSNQAKFYDRFDAVVLLAAGADVILPRVAVRATNDFGKSPDERELILRDLASVEPLLRATCTHELDASVPLEDIVAALISIGRDGH